MTESVLPEFTMPTRSALSIDVPGRQTIHRPVNETGERRTALWRHPRPVAGVSAAVPGTSMESAEAVTESVLPTVKK